MALDPAEQGMLVTNLIAALLAAVMAGLGITVMRRFGPGWVSSVVTGLQSAVSFVGVEAIDALVSSFMLLLYLSALVLAFRLRSHVVSRPRTIAVASRAHVR